jgi:hypothetical protein
VPACSYLEGTPILSRLIYPKLALTEAQEQEGTEEGTMSEEASPSPLP